LLNITAIVNGICYLKRDATRVKTAVIHCQRYVQKRKKNNNFGKNIKYTAPYYQSRDSDVGGIKTNIDVKM